MNLLTFTPTDPHDPLALALVEELFAEYRSVDDTFGAGPGHNTDDYAAPHGIFLIARLGETVVGCGAIRPIKGAERVAEVKRMYVRPEARRQGIARHLLHALEEAARSVGYTAVRLTTGPSQKEASQLYQAVGFTPIPCWGHYANQADERCFAKEL